MIQIYIVAAVTAEIFTALILKSGKLASYYTYDIFLYLFEFERKEVNEWLLTEVPKSLILGVNSHLCLNQKANWLLYTSCVWEEKEK